MTQIDSDPRAPESPAGLAPVAAAERFFSIDALRGFALLGILWMNIPFFALSSSTWADPRVDGGFTGLDRLVWLLGHYVFDLKMMSLFSMLFGAGLIVMSGRAASRGAGIARIYYRRLFWLLVIGLVHAYLIWFGDILVPYAICGALAFFFRKIPGHYLVAIGLALILVAIPINVGQGLIMREDAALAAQAEALRAAGETPAQNLLDAEIRFEEQWSWAYPDEEALEEERAYHASTRALLAAHAEETVFWQTFGLLFWGLWRIGGLMLLGMGLFKLGVFTAQRSDRFYAAMAIAGYAVGFALISAGVQRNFAHSFDGAFLHIEGFHWNYVGSLCVALAHTGVVMLLVRRGALVALTSRLAAVGRMALTNYLAQSLLMTAVFYPWGFNLWSRLDRAELALVVIATWTLQLLWSPWWLARFRFGPMEWVWRSLTYWRRQPMRLDAPLPA